MTTIPVLKSLVLVILSRSIKRRSPPACLPKRSRLLRSLIGSVVLASVSLGTAQADERQRSDFKAAHHAIQLAQSSAPGLRPQSATRNSQVGRARSHCRKVSQRFRDVLKKSCIRGDRLNKARSLCVPPKGLYKAYSRWDPAAGRCKPRHRFDGGTCAGGKRRYGAGKHHAHEVSQSVRMYGKAPTRLAAALKSCRNGVVDLRGKAADKRIVKQRLCAHARRQNDRSQINLYCK